MQKIYIFTGKGGVGKSSIAAAHAVKSAEEGKHTLLMSTDMAHNLGDIFEKKLAKEPENVLPNLDVYEIDPEYVMQNDFSFIMEYLGKLLSENVMNKTAKAQTEKRKSDSVQQIGRAHV